MTVQATAGDQDSILRIEVDRTDGAVELHLIGEMDLSTRGQVVGALGQAPADAGPVVLDLRRLEFCDATGLGELVAVHDVLMAHHRHCAAVDVPPHIMRLMRITGIDELCEVETA